MSVGLTALCIVFVALMALRVPIAAVIGLSSAAYLLVEGFPLGVAAQRMFTGVDVFLLLAIPLFALAGEVMNLTGLTLQLVALAQALVGRVRGGLAAVTVLTSVLFAGISGSGAADAAAVGGLMGPAMKKAGYPPSFSAALIAISSIVGPIIPPSIVFILYGALADTSVLDLFLAGVFPGLLLGGVHLATAVLISARRGYERGEPTNAKKIARATILAVPALIIPVVIIGGIRAGAFTPTEAGAVTVLYALVLGGAIFAFGKWIELGRIGTRVGLQLGDILLIIGTSNVLAWILTIEKVPQTLSSLILSISNDKVVILILINLILLIVGMFLDTFPAMIILIPILLPLITAVQVDPIHFGVIMTVNLMIGAVTPPVGILLFIANRITGANILDSVRESLIFVAVSILALVLITFVPEISLWLPSALKN